MNTFTHNEKDFLMNGQLYRIISGAMHYFRIPQDYWYDRLLKLKQCGFNTVETYTCWNLHEPEEGVYDFSGMLDLGRYIDTAKELGLNVIVRPGPYICSEWDFGGFPAWLLKYEDCELRCNNERYLGFVRRYFEKLFAILTPRLITHGGNIIMLQIENEYGSYGDDKEYLRAIAQMYKDLGADCQFFTSDGATAFMLGGGTLPEYPCVANFGSHPKDNFDYLRFFRPDQPTMCGEYWCGWFDHWHGEHHVRESNECAEVFKEMLDMGASVNFYMFHGGTNFGYMNGANHYEHYEPDVTSYDYCAPLSEAGDFTPAYYAVRDVISGFTGNPAPEITAKNTEKAAYGKFEFTEIAPLFDTLNTISTPVHTAAPKYMEDIGLYYGFTLYSTTVNGPLDKLPLEFDVCNDRAAVFFDGKFMGIKERTWIDDEIKLELGMKESVKVDILCENMGRVNYGQKLRDRKGLKGIRFGQRYHFGWDMYPLSLKNASDADYKPYTAPVSQPCFLRGFLNIVGQPKDTFIQTTDMKHGMVIVNGFNLGRYYNAAGPQKTLFVPAPMLKEGKNEIIVFDMEGCTGNTAEFFDKPQLD